MGVQHLAHAGGLAHAALHDVDPLSAGRREHEVVVQLARKDVGHIHDVLVAVHRRLQYVHLGRRHRIHAHGIRQVLVHLALEARLIVQEVAARLVEQRQVHGVEQVHHARQPLHGRMREYLEVHQLALHDDLRAVRRHEVHAVHDGLEQLAQRVEAPPRRGREPHAPLPQAQDELVRAVGHALVRVEHGAVHIAGDELEHGNLLC